MVTRLQVGVLLDTGPTAAEVGDIEALFDALDMDAVPEGHSYGGPPPTSAFLIVVTCPLAPFLDRFVAGGVDGQGALEHLIRRLQGMRADTARWGKPHGVKLEDSHSGHVISLPADLPSQAYRALMNVEVSSLDRIVPLVQLEWNTATVGWQARLTTAPRRLARRAPHRWDSADRPRARQLSEPEVADLWRLASTGAGSAITWQRARVVLWSALGWSIGSIAQHTVLTPNRVQDIIRNFNVDGFAALGLGYPGGEQAKPTATEQADAEAIALRQPTEFGLAGHAWSPVELGEFLVTEGVVDDVDLGWLESLLVDSSTNATPDSP